MVMGVSWAAVIIIAILFSVESAGQSLPVIVALFVLSTRLLVIGCLSKRDSNNPQDQAVAGRAHHEIIERSGEAMLRVSAEVSRQVGEILNEVARAQNQINEVVGKLGSSFQNMNSRVQRQLQLEPMHRR